VQIAKKSFKQLKKIWHILLLTNCGARRSKAYALAPSKCTKYGYFGKKYVYFIHKIAIFKYFCVFLKHKSAGFGGWGPKTCRQEGFYKKNG
jgi:hypothetical protein